MHIVFHNLNISLLVSVCFACSFLKTYQVNKTDSGLTGTLSCIQLSCCTFVDLGTLKLIASHCPELKGTLPSTHLHCLSRCVSLCVFSVCLALCHTLFLSLSVLVSTSLSLSSMFIICILYSLSMSPPLCLFVCLSVSLPLSPLHLPLCDTHTHNYAQTKHVW